MTEIELKAHVSDRAALAARLDAFATYKGHCIRRDSYYGRSADDPHKIRLRQESEWSGGTERSRYLLTYKRKELRTAENGTSIEVNHEEECTLSSPQAVLSFLQDAGYSVQLRKEKDVMDWTAAVTLPTSGAGTATLELCAVLPLGDFLEIEILSPTDDAETVAACRSQLEALLDAAGIPREAIETRYYSELLREQTHTAQSTSPLP